MLLLKLAFRNLIGAGLRTWLNVIVLSFSFIMIVWYQGLLDGWNAQARRDMTDWQVGRGQYWHARYDPFDPLSLDEAHAPVPATSGTAGSQAELVPILISQGTIYPQGRMKSVLLKGIDPDQSVLSLPTRILKDESDGIPALIGTRMAASSKLKPGDYVTLRWRDSNGAFDAAEIRIAGIFKCNVPVVDNNQLWLPLRLLQEMKQLPGEATMLVAGSGNLNSLDETVWKFQSPETLLAEIEQLIRQKSIGASVMYLILMSLALLALFDTQVFSIFRRKKEIGTQIALGMTRRQVVALFTLEGSLHSVLAALLAALYGIPLLSWQALRGFAMPQGTDDYGLAIAEKIFPLYSAGLILGTTLLIFVTATFVSFLPARRISKMQPTDALRGRLQ